MSPAHALFPRFPRKAERSGANIMVRKIVTLALIAGSFIVAACNTVEGAGKDVKSAGAAVEDAAK